MSLPCWGPCATATLPLTIPSSSCQVPEEYFPTLLAYLEGLQGKAREMTLQKAEALMRELDAAGADAALPGRAPRLRQVLQLLS